MNFTLTLLSGLILLLPGITALVIWNNQGSAQGAKRPELQFTAVNAIFVTLSVAIVMHILGFALVQLIWTAAVELGERTVVLGSLIQNPYDMAIDIAMGAKHVSPLSLFAFLIVTLFECILAASLVASRGADIMFDALDLRSQGWVFQHVVRPMRHGYTPVAHVLTTAASGDYGIGYEGTIADIREGENGELKSISLAEPERFIYQIVPVSEKPLRRKPRLVTHAREWIGGIVALDGAMVRNIVVHNIPQDVIEQVEDYPVDEAGRPAGAGASA